MGSRLVIALSGLLVVATANATAILGPNGFDLVDYSTGVYVGATETAGTQYFDPASPVAITTTQDLGYNFKFWTNGAGANIPAGSGEPSLIESPSLIPSGFVPDSGNGEWIGFCDCVSTDISASGVSNYVSFSIPFDTTGTVLANDVIKLEWAADTRGTNTATMWVNSATLVSSVPSGVAGYGSLTSVTIQNGTPNCANCIVNGQNTLQIRLSTNSATLVDPLGVIVEFQEADDTPGNPIGPGPSGVPEPGSTLLIVTGLVALVAGVRRSRRS